jgi:cellulose synthase/poly-beta-1,6-N-acetylglucosamine synthase-like glycosyltransferase
MTVDWHLVLEGLSWLYAISNMALALFAFNMFFLLALAIWHWREAVSPAKLPAPAEWPTVLVQLPIFNERYVVERLIDAAAALDYPADRLIIQVLDDSTDDTAALAEARVAFHLHQGRHIDYLRRTERTGYKAGALAAGLAVAPSEFTVVFDADFVPPTDYLRKLIPEFIHNPRLGMLQARWGHLNPGQNMLTRAMALAFDSFFSVDQVARSGAGLMMNFNGSAGILRRTCIEEAGGWQHDTLVEDMDLSYRAQITGWQIKYRLDVVVPGELPASIIALKQQQYRWAKGATQVLRKLWRPLCASPKPLLHKLQGLLHLSGYLPHPLMVASLLLSLPVVYLHGQTPISWGVLGLAALAPPLEVIWGQSRLRHDWHMSWLYYPALFLVGIGVAVTDTRAIWDAFFGHTNVFVRTPKFAAASQRHSSYALPVDWSTWVEAALAIYGLGSGLLATQWAPTLAPFILVYAAGFGFTAVLGFWQGRGVSSKHAPDKPQGATVYDQQ